MPASVRESLTGNLRRKAQFTSVTGFQMNLINIIAAIIGAWVLRSRLRAGRKADSNRWSHLRLNGSDAGERDEQIAMSPLRRIDKQSLERLVIAHTSFAGPSSGAVQPGGGRLDVLKSVSVVS
jgi:hypothetical protein